MSLRLKNAVCFMLNIDLTYRNEDIEKAIYRLYPEWELLQKDTVWIMELFLNPNQNKINSAKRKLINKTPVNNKKQKIKLKAKLDKDFKNKFYFSKKWKKLRRKIHSNWDRSCMKCGCRDEIMHVDHIKPRSKYRHLQLDPFNMQILCKDCNYEKSNKNCNDYRPDEFKLSIIKDFNLNPLVARVST